MLLQNVLNFQNKIFEWPIKNYVSLVKHLWYNKSYSSSNISFLVNTRVVKNAVSVKISIYCKRSIKILSRAARASTSHVLVEKFNIWIKRTFLLFFGRSHVTNRTTYKLMFSRNLKIGKYIVENTFKSRAVLLCNTTADE